MDEKIQGCLYDILRAIDEVEEFVPDHVSFEDYSNELKTKRAVERNIEIIGEAVGRILKIDKDFHLPDSKKIVATRNRIIHGYDDVSDKIIWGIVQNHLPELRSRVDELLGE